MTAVINKLSSGKSETFLEVVKNLPCGVETQHLFHHHKNLNYFQKLLLGYKLLEMTILLPMILSLPYISSE